jgi:hypothetical protein
MFSIQPDLTSLPFQKAAAEWLESRKPYISERTHVDYTHYINTLSLFFGEPFLLKGERRLQREPPPLGNEVWR